MQFVWFVDAETRILFIHMIRLNIVRTNFFFIQKPQIKNKINLKKKKYGEKEYKSNERLLLFVTIIFHGTLAYRSF